MSHIIKSIAILNTSAPFSKPNGKEALDAALIFGSYEQPTSLFFQGDGVWQLINAQQPDKITIKDYLKTFAAFEFYDLDKIYVCQKSLLERGLASEFHIDGVLVLSSDEFSTLLHQQQVIFRF